MLNTPFVRPGRLLKTLVYYKHQVFSRRKCLPLYSTVLSCITVKVMLANAIRESMTQFRTVVLTGSRF